MTSRWREGVTQEGGLTIERIAIREPVWSSHEIGIATFRARRAHVIEVKLMYRIKGGKALIHKILSMPSERVLMYRRMRVSSEVELCMIPIVDFELKREGA